jgi:hypothetical protein
MPETIDDPESLARFYRLEPIIDTLHRKEWAASMIKETCWVRATSEREARTLVEAKTRPRQPQGKPFFSPWSSSAFTICSMEGKDAPFHHHSPVGLVLTANGPVNFPS